MKNCHFLSAALLLSFAPPVSLGQSPAAQDDVADRINRQEAETQALREEMKRLREETVRLPAIEATPTGMAPAPDAVDPAPLRPHRAGVPERPR